MKFIVLCQHANFALKLRPAILPLQEFLLLVLNLVLLETKGGLGLKGVTGFLKFHNDIDISNEIVGLIGGVLGHEGLAHHN